MSLEQDVCSSCYIWTRTRSVGREILYTVRIPFLKVPDWTRNAVDELWIRWVTLLIGKGDMNFTEMYRD